MNFEFLLPRNTKNVDLNLVINSNDRFHFHKKARMTSQLKSLAHYEAITFNGIPFSEKKPCNVHVIVYSPTKSKLDPPNLYPTVKALIDGLTVAGIWTDDNHKIIQLMTFKYGGLSNKKGHYKIVLEIEEVEE